jgi:hypothetical protein
MFNKDFLVSTIGFTAIILIGVVSIIMTGFAKDMNIDPSLIISNLLNK